MLRFYVGLSTPEIAETLGISPDSVKTHVRRGMAALRSVLERIRMSAEERLADTLRRLEAYEPSPDLIFGGYLLVTSTIAPVEVKRLVYLLQESAARVGGMLLLMGVLHTGVLAALLMTVAVVAFGIR